MRAEFDFWQTTTLKGRLYFHPPDVPVEVWAVRIDRHGVHWFDTEVLKVTARNVVVRYAGEIARLDRGHLYRWWAFWRGVRFVASRTGRIAAALDEAWWERYGQAGAPPPSLRMPLEEARLLLGLPENYTKEDVLTAFRRAVKKRIRTWAERQRCSISWSRRVTGCSPRWGRARRHPSRRPMCRAARRWSIGAAALVVRASARPAVCRRCDNTYA